ncbi:hypothetical protein NESM_000492600 [Novymonas esmeraldas]|uniref:Autotransporter domain-containing protein n=1 Tax=Novymonas esmeraldas TaxID=1808958 RepID=A0AAW0EQ43_9TRYP
MPSMGEYWRGGFRALHIEECIGNAFADLAPYAGADQQRITVSRQTPAPGRPVGWSGGDTSLVGTPLGPASHTPSSSSVTLENNGDFTVQMRHPHAGAMSFSTSRHMQLDAAARLELPLRYGVDRSSSSGAELTNVSAHTPPAAVDAAAGVPAPSQRRFSDLTRPLAVSRDAAAPWGRLEVDTTLPDWSGHRQSIGARAGPAAVRVSRTLSAATTTSPMHSTSLSEDDLLAATTGGKDREHQYALDAAVCVAVGGSGDSGTAAHTVGGAPVVLLPSAPWAVACGVQLPFTVGDTLIGVSLQNDRASSTVLPTPGVEWATTSTAPKAEADAAPCIACVPSLLHAAPRARRSGDGEVGTPRGAPTAAAAPVYVAIPAISVRVLLVQTLASHTLVRRPSSGASASQLDGSADSSRVSSSYDWRQLPTLVGVNVGLDRDRLRVSVASILHNGEVDLEAAAVLDTTPWMPRMPTVLRLGYNNAGRFAAGVTSLFYETVSATLGVHKARGEQAKFGIDVVF